MSFTEFLLDFLSLYESSYKSMRKKLHGFPDEGDQAILKKKRYLANLKDASLRTILWRLKSRGFVENKNHKWSITNRGIEYLKSIKNKVKKNKQIFDKNKKIIIIFDIPEKFKKKRDCLRLRLSSMGFKILQKSVWIGPSPLPVEFIKYLKKLSILKFVQFFKILNEDLV